MTRPGRIVILPIALVGALATSIAVIDRADSDSMFTYQQGRLTSVSPSVLERFVASAPDPRPGKGAHRGIAATCTTLGVGELRNPWTCKVRYPVGDVTYNVVISPTGQINGTSANGSLIVYGCCVGYRPSQ